MQHLLLLVSVLKRNNASETCISEVLITLALCSEIYYHSVHAHLKKMLNVSKRYAKMCQEGHMAATGTYRTIPVCPLADYRRPVDGVRKY